MRARKLLALTALTLGCGGPSPAGSGSVTGADGFAVKSALSNVQAAADGGLSVAVFFLTDVDTDCADVGKRGQVPFSQSVLVGDVLTESLLGAGVADVDGGVGLSGTVTVQHTGGSDQATQGTIDLSALDSTHLVGTVTVTLTPSGGAPAQLTATFDAPVCAAAPVSQ
jgi:hypothetical protein